MLVSDANAAVSRADALLARADQLCRARHLRLTGLRRRVLDALARTEQPLGAYDLAERLSRLESRIAPISVYRALAFLTDLGLVHRIATRNAYVSCGCRHRAGEAVVLLVCTRCGVVMETSSAELERGLDGTVASVGFKPLSHMVEIEGECAACGTVEPAHEHGHE
jgi:Fur family zinc uptake transcriptional regulator